MTVSDNNTDDNSGSSTVSMGASEPRHAGARIDNGVGSSRSLTRGRHAAKAAPWFVPRSWMIGVGALACAAASIAGVHAHNAATLSQSAVSGAWVSTANGGVAASRSFEREPLDSTYVDGEWGGLEQLDIEYSRSDAENKALSDLNSKHDEAQKKLDDSDGKVDDNATRDTLEKTMTVAASFIESTGDKGAVDTDKANEYTSTLTDNIAAVDASMTKYTEKKQAEEEAAKAISSSSSGSSSSSSSSSASSAPASTPTSEMQQWAHDYMLANGYTESDWNAANYIIQRESGWNPYATNASSGAYGLPQALPGSKMASVGSDWATNYQTQFKWFLNYCSRYGGVTGAYNFWLTHHWY